MADWKTPPTVEPSLKAEIDNMVSVFRQNVVAIRTAMISGAVAAAGVTPKVSPATLTQLIEGVIVPQVHKFEGGWSDHPNDSGGATMRGVILTTLRGTFDAIFINTGITAVKTAAQNWNANHPGWKTADSNGPNDQLGKKLLYILCSDAQVGGLFFYRFLCAPENKYPIAVMTEDPYLGFLFGECCWGSGGGFYKNNGILTLAQTFGWSGTSPSFTSYICGLGDRTPEFAVKTLQKRCDFILKISQPGSKNSVFRKGWLNRLINDPTSNTNMLAVINETFNLNSKGLFKFTPAETAHLQRKAEIYKTVKIEFPQLS